MAERPQLDFDPEEGILRDFPTIYPETGDAEMRWFVVEKPGGPIPADAYALVEQYCLGPECDCRRVTFRVLGEKQGWVATIGYSFEPPDPDDPLSTPDFDMDRQVYQQPFAQQSQFSDAIQAFLEEVVLTDTEYLARLERHYHLTKEACRERARQVPTRSRGAGASVLRSIGGQRSASRRRRKKPGRNAPCPCGSGEKFKRCCG